jgi:two-component system, OmpR family, response regulator QseB
MITYRPRILLVETDDSVGVPLRAGLELNAFDVESSEDDDGAIERMTEETFDALVVDVRLSRRSGLGLLEHIGRTLPDFLTRTVVISSDVAADVTREMKAIGVCDVVPKPVHLDTIVEAIRDCLEKTSPTVH